MSDWRTLFGGSVGGQHWKLWRWHLLRRRGHDFLLLPELASPAAQTLALHPAQTLLARAACQALRCWLRLRLPVPFRWATMELSESAPLLAFLTWVAGTPPLAVGLLCGNPLNPAQRFILLVFDAAEKVVAVVKVAAAEAGRALIRREADFLESCSGMQGLPRLLGRLSHDAAEAFAMEFVPGNSPAVSDIAALARTLHAWIDPQQSVPLGHIPSWQLLAKDGAFSTISEQRVRPVIFHGDLAPWNVRVSQGEWTVLDWERGEKVGVPTWDWFHFELQHAILVRRLSATALLSLAEEMLARPEFISYAKTVEAAGCERLLLHAYLRYAVEVLQQTEGMARLRELERAWATRVTKSGGF